MAEGVVAIRSKDIGALERLLDADPALARKAQLVVDAGGAANRAPLELLASRGADLNARWRGYRALHALIQSEPHAAVDPPSTKWAHRTVTLIGSH